jgi:signal peptidase I
VSSEQPAVDEIEDEDDGSAEASGARRARRRKNSRRNAIEWIVVVAGALIVALIIKTFLFQAFYIPSESMEPTLNIGDRVLVNKLSYRLHDVHHSDIVVFERPSTDPQTVEGCDGHPVTITPSKGTEDVKDLIKRVIAVGGETVENRQGVIFVNGKALDEPYAPDAKRTPFFDTYSAQCIKVPDGDVFVLGDNRQHSSASNNFGPIPESLIVGRAFVRVWPLGDIGGL